MRELLLRYSRARDSSSRSCSAVPVPDLYMLQRIPITPNHAFP